MLNYVVRSIHIGEETEHPNFHKVSLLFEHLGPRLTFAR
jgi:hypothetical protein